MDASPAEQEWERRRGRDRERDRERATRGAADQQGRKKAKQETLMMICTGLIFRSLLL